MVAGPCDWLLKVWKSSGRCAGGICRSLTRQSGMAWRWSRLSNPRPSRKNIIAPMITPNSCRELSGCRPKPTLRLRAILTAKSTYLLLKRGWCSRPPPCQQRESRVWGYPASKTAWVWMESPSKRPSWRICASACAGSTVKRTTAKSFSALVQHT